MRTSRKARAVLLGVLALGPLGFAASRLGEGVTGSTEPPPPPVHTELGFTLMRVGLGAESLAALGLSSAQVKAVVEAAQARINQTPSALSSAEAAYEQAKKGFDALAGKVQSGRASTAEITACQQANADCESTQAACTAILDGFFSAGVAGLSTAQQELLATIRENRKWGLAVPHLVKNRTEAEWIELSDALDTKRIHDRYGEPFPQAVQTYLAQEEADVAVAAAKVNLATFLASVQVTWNTEVSE